MSNLKHFAVAAVLVGLATQVRAGYFPGSTDFEDNPLTNTVIWSGIGDAAIETDATVGSAERATYRPSTFSTAAFDKVLSIDNDADAPITCDLGGDTSGASSVYADVLIKSNPLANDAAAPEVGQYDKILVYARVNATGTDTNLCVLARPDANSLTNEYALTSTHIGQDEWHRIIVEAVNDGTYKVYCDDFDRTNPLGTYYPINEGSSISKVAFSGSGCLDDLIFSTWEPELPIHTLTWDTSFASVSYVVGDATNALTVSDGSLEFQVPNGSSVTLVGNTGYYDVTTNASAAAGSILALNLTAPTGLAKFAPGASSIGAGTVANPYQIPDYETLLAMQVAVANDASFRSASYLQTADIALAAPWPGIGVGAAKDLVNGDAKDIPAFEAGAFSGTYDGDNFTISGFQMVNGTDYGALFNSVNNATIKNLKISWLTTKLCANSSDSGDDTGATFVGVARGSTLQNLTALEGTNKVVYASKDMGGIVGYLMAGSTVDSCTNELNLASFKNSRKCGGIAIITQDGSGTATIQNCKNSGTITTPSSNKNGAFVGYLGTTTAIIGCENTANASLLTCHDGSVTVSGGTKSVANRAAYVMDQGGPVTGLDFAIVDGNVATFVSTLEAGNTYKVMASGATATYAFTAPGTIAFDTSLQFTPTYAISAVEGLTLTDATSGNVKTYTAAVQAPQGFNDPQGTAIEDPAVIEWLSDNGFTQADINALGNNYAALEKFYEAYIVNYDFRVQGAGVALSFTDITVGNDNITVTVQLVRTAPLGAIHGKLYFYGATDLTAGFGERPIVDTSVSFGDTDETFDTTPTEDTVTQTATATLTFVSDKFFKAQIHAELPDNGE